MRLSEFNYDLPKELIAQEPLKSRDSARLMVVDRQKDALTERAFCDIVEYFTPGDCLVLNDTKVIPVRLYGNRKTGAKVEIFLLDPGAEKLKALIKPSKRIKEGEEIELESGFLATVMERTDVGRFVKFNASLEDVLEKGHVPLPPYIIRHDTPRDREDYQTVYADKEGATASPTAGLHFTNELLKRINEKGVKTVFVTLHTSYGTFSPVKEENIEDHKMHFEYYHIGEAAAEVVNKTKLSGSRVFAVGTTSSRVLESSSVSSGEVKAFSGKTDLFIYPGYKYKIVDGLITNFHLPESTLLMLVSALAGKDLIFKAYEQAIKNKFRFFSYGDAMLIL